MTSLISKSVKSNASLIKACNFHCSSRPVTWQDIKPTCKTLLKMLSCCGTIFLFIFLFSILLHFLGSTTKSEVNYRGRTCSEFSSWRRRQFSGRDGQVCWKKNSVWSRLEGLLNSGCHTGVWRRCCPGWHLLGLKSFAQFSRSFLSFFDIYDVRIWNRNYFGRNTYPFLLRNVGWMETCF